MRQGKKPSKAFQLVVSFKGRAHVEGVAGTRGR